MWDDNVKDPEEQHQDIINKRLDKLGFSIQDLNEWKKNNPEDVHAYLRMYKNNKFKVDKTIIKMMAREQNKEQDNHSSDENDEEN